MRSDTKHAVLIVAVWLVLVGSGLLARPAVPADETRYLAVAWEMWQRGEAVLPTLNGVPYSHKPPLLFWLIHAGWAVLGISAAWARLVPALCALATVALTWRLARRLWPEHPEVAPVAGWLLLGTLAWSAYSTVLLVDMLLACCTASAVLAVVEANRRPAWQWWMLLASAIGLGLLAKGPVTLVFVLPVGLLAPLWRVAERPSHARWYGGLLGALTLAAAMAGAWAVPAAMRGGEAYRDAILWGQVASRLGHAVTHPRPWYAYLALLPVVLLPWILWPPLWRAARAGGALLSNRGLRLCLAWSLPAVVLLHLVPDKQPHYLLPILPALALAAALVLARLEESPAWSGQVLPAATLAGVGVLLAVLPALAISRRWPEWVGTVSPLWGAALVLVAVVPLLPLRLDRAQRVAVVAVSTVMWFTVLHLAVVRAGGGAFDVRPVAEVLARAEAEGRPIAHVGPYHGQYHFYGRLECPLVVIEPEEIPAWSAAHPRGRVVVYLSHWGLDGAGEPVLQRPFRGRTGVSVWDRDAILAELAGGTPRWRCYP